MHKVDVHYDMQAPLERVLAFLENFADIQAWWPAGQAATAREFLRGAYQLMFRGLEAAAKRQRA